MKEFIGTCVENPFGDMGILVNVVENNAKEITKSEFLSKCRVHPNTKKDMAEYPDDYGFYKSRAGLGNDAEVYFYTHSAIEHFYT